MTLPQEMYNSIRSARMFMVALLDPALTPRVPKHIRMRARDRLKHFPNEFDIKQMEERHQREGDFGYPFFNETKEIDNG